MINYPTNIIQRCIDCNGSTALPVGQDGEDGQYGGYSSIWRFSTSTTPGDPGLNYLLFDGSITAIYVSTTNADTNNQDSFLSSLDNNTNFGYIKLFKEYNSNIHWYGEITGVTNFGSYYKLDVINIANNGTFNNNDKIVLTFSPRGAAGINGASGTNGTNGTNGTDGIDGLYGGFSRMWKFDTSSAPGPASTYLRYSGSTPSLISAIYVNETDADSLLVTGFLGAINNSSNFGYVKIFKEYDSTIFHMYEVTNIVDNGTYRTIVVSYIDGNGAFSMDDNVVLSFTPRGASYNPLNNYLVSIGTLPTFLNNANTELKDGVIVVPTGLSLEEDPLNAYDSATGVWTCPINGYYDISFLVNFTTGSFGTLGGYVYAGLTNNTTPASIVASSDIAQPSATCTAIQLSSAYVMRKIAVGTTLTIRLLNKTGGTITPAVGSSIHFTLKLVKTY